MTKGVIIVEGMIGAGKSSLSLELAQALKNLNRDDTIVLMEPDEQKQANPYLSDFYQDQARWAYVMQTHLLQARFRQHLQAQFHAMSGKGYAVLDRSFYGDTAFAKLQLRLGTMSPREFQTYTDLYDTMTSFVKFPTFCVRLLVSPEVARERIARRMSQREGRRCESGLSLEYLLGLEEEINHMVAVLKQHNVTVVEVPWDVERANSESRVVAINGLVSLIRGRKPLDMMLDRHNRVI